MKKALSLALAGVMALALAVPAFAETEPVVPDTSTTGTGSDSTDITATYDELEDPEVATVYLVTVDWSTEGTLTYTNGKTAYKWNAADTKYEKVAADSEDAGWSGEVKVTVNVTNKSNAEVEASASWEAKNVTSVCAFTSDVSKVTVENAAKDVEIADGKTGSAKTATISGTVTVSEGTINVTDTVIGTLTVTIAPAPAAEP